MKFFDPITRLHANAMSRLSAPMANKPYSTARKLFFAGFVAGGICIGALAITIF